MADLQIAAFRRRAGLTQLELAAKLRISRQHLSALENGKRELLEYMERRIIVALDVKPDEVNVMLGAPPFRRRGPGPAGQSRNKAESHTLDQGYKGAGHWSTRRKR